MNKYTCSDGTRVSEATIQKRLSESYRLLYEGNPHPMCYTCGQRATETSHLVAKARCKQLNKTELIWDKNNMTPACRECHTKWEAINNPAWCSLNGIEYLLESVERFDKEGYIKRMIVYDKV